MICLFLIDEDQCHWIQGVRVRVTPLWQLSTSQSSSVLLELPAEEEIGHEQVTAALALIRQPQTQVEMCCSLHAPCVHAS